MIIYKLDNFKYKNRGMDIQNAFEMTAYELFNGMGDIFVTMIFILNSYYSPS